MDAPDDGDFGVAEQGDGCRRVIGLRLRTRGKIDLALQFAVLNLGDKDGINRYRE